MVKFRFFLAVGLMVGLLACRKEGVGGDATITGQVIKKDSMLIPNATVYIKYGAKDFPGFDVSQYDNQVGTGDDAEYLFEKLHKGDYYLLARGIDTANLKNVVGGARVKIASKTAFIEIDISVTDQ